MKKITFSLASLKHNWQSGLTVALISIPLSISLAVASGVSPLAGIITAMWAGLIGALFGSSNYNIIGPTGALSGIIATYALHHGQQNVAMLAIMTGIFVLVAYICKLERYLVLIPSSVIHGFTLGVACIIALNQLNFALGLQLPRHERLLLNVLEACKHFRHISLPALGLFVLFFLGLLVLRKLIPTIPGAIVLSPLGIAIGYASTHGIIPIFFETLGSKFGTIQPALYQLPTYTFNIQIIGSAFVTAFIAIIETMLSAKIADGITKTKHNAHTEVLGLGCANLVSGLLGGIPATAALARTSLNINTGATSRLSALLNSAFIALISFLCLSYFAFMPMAVIAAILVYVALNMIEREHFYRLFEHDKGNFAIAMLVAFITIYADPILGILAGTAMALLLLINKLVQSYYDIAVHEIPRAPEVSTAKKKNVLIYALKGKLAYLNSQAHVARFMNNFTEYDGVILSLHDVYYIDIDGVDALDEIIELLQCRKQTVMVVQPRKHVGNMLHGSKAYQSLERAGHVFESVDAALKQAA